MTKTESQGSTAVTSRHWAPNERELAVAGFLQRILSRPWGVVIGFIIGLAFQVHADLADHDPVLEIGVRYGVLVVLLIVASIFAYDWSRSTLARADQN